MPPKYLFLLKSFIFIVISVSKFSLTLWEYVLGGVCVCVQERERERERGRQTERQRDRETEEKKE